LRLFFLRDDPLGQIPDSERDETGIQNKEEVLVETEGPLFTSRWKQALSTSPFWQLSAAYLVCGITTNIISVHFVPFAEDQGVPKITAATIFGIMMGLNSVGVISAGVLSQKFSQHRVLGFTYALRGIAYLTLLTIG